MSAETLPPWGQLEEPMEEEIRSRPIPEAWRSISSRTRESDFAQWRDHLIDELAALIWPTYDFAHRRWSKPPSDQLLEVDFQLLKKLHRCLELPINGFGVPPTPHSVFFAEEDDVYKLIGLNYERYDPALPEYLRENLKDVLINGFSRKLASLHLQLKKRFQRPRAYQVALLSRRPFHYLWAATGGTPSLVSGHCLQGSLAGISAYVLFGRDVDLVSVEILKQFTVDIGDRRVFAGVHYPSDNLSSWYTALKLLPHVLDQSQVRQAHEFLWDAISKKSTVYREIVKHADKTPDSPYRPAIQALNNLAAAGG